MEIPGTTAIDRTHWNVNPIGNLYHNSDGELHDAGTRLAFEQIQAQYPAFSSLFLTTSYRLVFDGLVKFAIT